MTTDPASPPPGKLISIITYLEMLARPQRPMRLPPGPQLQIQRVWQPSVAFYRFLYNSVGEPWAWVDRRRWSDAQLAEEIQHPQVEVHLLCCAGEPAGYAELDFRDAQNVELRYFGIRPEYVGCGLGPYLLDWTIDEAWQRGTRRYWVHTCTFDSPRALPMYRAAGFVDYDQQSEWIDDPWQDGTLPSKT